MYGKNDLGKKEELKKLMKQDKEGIAYDIDNVKSTTDKAKKKYWG